MVVYVFRDGSRLTPYMLYQINRADADFFRKFGCHILVTSGIRTNAEQTRIFLSKFRLQATGSGPYGDVRRWQGRRYVRVVGGGTVAPPGSSNHEIQGSKAAVDLRDSGDGPGVATGRNARANWLRANAHKYGLEPEGYSFDEPWHYAVLNIFNAVPGSAAGGAGGSVVPPEPAPKPKEVRVNDYPRVSDDTAKTVGRDMKPGATFFLHDEAGQSTSAAKNVAGKAGPYSFSVNVYATGRHGDALEVQLRRAKSGESASDSHVQRFTFDDDGLLRNQASFVLPVGSGESVYVLVTAIRTNKAPLKVTRLDVDARLFTVA